MKETNPDEGEYPTATESCAADKQMNHQDHLFFLQLFVAQLSNCRQTFLYFQLLQHIPMSKPLISPSNYPSSMFVHFGKFVPMCWEEYLLNYLNALKSFLEILIYCNSQQKLLKSPTPV